MVADPAHVLDARERPRLGVGQRVQKVAEQRQVGADVDQGQLAGVLAPLQLPSTLDEQVLLGVQRGVGEPGRRQPHAGDHGVEISAIEAPQQVRRVAVVKVDRAFGAACAPAPPAPGTTTTAPARSVCRPPARTAADARSASRRPGSRSTVGQHLPRQREQPLPGLGQRDLAGGPRQHRRAQALLEAPDAIAKTPPARDGPGPRRPGNAGSWRRRRSSAANRGRRPCRRLYGIYEQCCSDNSEIHNASSVVPWWWRNERHVETRIACTTSGPGVGARPGCGDGTTDRPRSRIRTPPTPVVCTLRLENGHGPPERAGGRRSRPARRRGGRRLRVL